MKEYIFLSTKELTEIKVWQILTSDPNYLNLKEESIGKFEGKGDGFNCNYFINKHLICVFKLGNDIVARVVVNPFEDTVNLEIAKEFSNTAERISRNI